MGILAGAAALALLLAGCAPEPEARPKAEALSASKAGGVYLDAVCPVNDAWDSVDVEIDRLRVAEGRGETGTSEFADAMRRLSEASLAAADALESDEISWPKDAASEVAAVAKTLRGDAKQAEKAAGLPIAKAVAYEWDGAEEAGADAAAARAALGLPADPASACAQWAEQQASRTKQPKTTDAPAGSDTGSDTGGQR